jgi:hypothetical protein
MYRCLNVNIYIRENLILLYIKLCINYICVHFHNFEKKR